MFSYFSFNPNDDFDLTALERWVAYAEYYYYKGVTLFDNYEELFKKIEQADFNNLHKEAVKHRVDNTIINHLNTKAIEKYFFDGENQRYVPKVPKTLVEGLKLWEEKIKRPKFEMNDSNVENLNGSESKDFILIDLIEYTKAYGEFPPCIDLSNSQIIYYYFNEVIIPNRYSKNINCKFIGIKEMTSFIEIQDILKIYASDSDKHVQLLIMLIYALNMNAKTIVTLHRVENKSNKLCGMSAKFSKIFKNSKNWYETYFTKNQFWYAWIPVIGKEYGQLWLRTLSKFTFMNDFDQNCLNIRSNKQRSDDYEVLNDYLKHWKSDETENFFHLVDQLNFEIAVRGYTTKFYGELHRIWMKSIASKIKVPKLQLN